jgi:protein arginine kinase activator
MLCQRCNQREATFHFAQMANGVLRELHLCSDCAGRQFMPDMLTGKQLLEQFLQTQSAPDVVCPACGTSLSDFRRTGYVGCPECYGVFEKQMEPMLMAVHGATRHMPPAVRADRARTRTEDLLALREQLDAAVKEERYEQAALIRDRLRALEGEAKP